MYFEEKDNCLIMRNNDEIMYLKAWGKNSLRFQMTRAAEMDAEDWALTESVSGADFKIEKEEVDMTEPFYHTPEEIEKHKQTGVIYYVTNGKIKAKIDPEGVISYYRTTDNALLTKEYWRNRNRIDRFCVPLRVDAREMKPIIGTTDYELTMRFEAFEGEKLFGLGQYQENCLDKKGCVLELAHRNSQSSVPFMISNRGYGFLWNNPAIGTVTLANNKTEWYAKSTKKLDYLIIAGDTPAEIEEQFANCTGKYPMIPEFGIGFWQCKLRYRTQEEVLKVAREYKKRNLPIDVIVIDFFHWTRQGEFKFDPHEWPNPEEMVKELKEMDIEPVVSVWPTIDEKSENFGEMASKGYLIKSDRGVLVNMTWMGNTIFYDATHPGAREFVWNKCKENYYDMGIKCFWLDEAEPEYGPYDFDLYRYYKGTALQCSNIYPLMYAKGFYDGMEKEGQENILNLVRAAWVGSQKYGVLAWSGDIHSSFAAMKMQVQAGLSMALAGISWWTSDIGGFLGGDNKSPEFKELMARWFAWGAFCPVFRLHGERSPYYERDVEYRDNIRLFSSAQDNEVWTWGEEIYEILKQFMLIREKLRSYIRESMKELHEKGTPVIRPLWYDFNADKEAWNVEDAYMFGPDILVKPITEAGVEETTVYLPAFENASDEWVESRTGKTYAGGQVVTAVADLGTIPVFTRKSKNIEVY
ncbi:MAG: family 31 glucosidase [Lachnospiraceae bacterium]|nr:family 31 glucosidase [Lachnospiraceae bacterium]